MLGKLMKYEWKNNLKIGGIMLLGIFAVTLIGCLVMRIPIVSEIFTEDTEFDIQKVFWVMMSIASMILYIFALVGVTYGLMIYLAIRFYKTMYTDEGYLTHTLPVTPNQIFLSKILVSGCTYLVIEIAVIVSVLALIFSLFGGIIVQQGYSVWELFSMIFEELAVVFEEEMGFDLIRYIITVVVMGLIGPFLSITLLFGCITLGQLSKKHKVVMSILAYFGVMLINMIISMVVQLVTTLKYSYELMNNPYSEMTINMNSTYDLALIMSFAWAIVMYGVSYYILNKKMNLE